MPAGFPGLALIASSNLIGHHGGQAAESITLGFRMTYFDTRNRICGDALARVQEMFPGQVFDTAIRTYVKTADGPFPSHEY